MQTKQESTTYNEIIKFLFVFVKNNIKTFVNEA